MKSRQHWHSLPCMTLQKVYSHFLALHSCPLMSGLQLGVFVFRYTLRLTFTVMVPRVMCICVTWLPWIPCDLASQGVTDGDYLCGPWLRWEPFFYDSFTIHTGLSRMTLWSFVLLWLAWDVSQAVNCFLTHFVTCMRPFSLYIRMLSLGTYSLSFCLNSYPESSKTCPLHPCDSFHLLQDRH